MFIFKQFWVRTFRTVMLSSSRLFQDSDIVLVDEGYWDTILFLQHLVIGHRMPAILQLGQGQPSTEEANEKRILTKSPWVLEIDI